MRSGKLGFRLTDCLRFSGYSSLPRSNHSVPDSRLDGSHSLLLGGDIPHTPRFSPDTSLLDPVSEDQETAAGEKSKGGAVLDVGGYCLHGSTTVFPFLCYRLRAVECLSSFLSLVVTGVTQCSYLSGLHVFTFCMFGVYVKRFLIS